MEAFQIISTLSELFPVLVGIVAYKKVGFVVRLFLFFLLLGLLVDSLSAVFYFNGFLDGITVLRYLYAPIEAFFFCFFCLAKTNFRFLHARRNTFFISVILTWLLIDVILVAGLKIYIHSLYETSWNVINSLLASSALLSLVETRPQNIFRNGVFWFLIGIFLYTFTTFFLSTFVENVIAQDYYFLHSGINISAQVTFGIGFFLSRFDS